MSKMHSSQIQPLQFTTTDLANIMNMAEANLKVAELCHHLFGNDEVVQQRAIAADIQARCEKEIARHELIRQERAQKAQEDAEKKKREEIEAKRKAEAEKKSAAAPAPSSPPEDPEPVKAESVKTESEAKSVPEQPAA